MTIEMFPTHEDPIPFVDLVKTISMVNGCYIILSVNGGLRNNTPESEHISPATIEPLEADTSLDLDRYANQAVITVDEDWTEETSTETTTVETGYGISRTIKKIGEQPQTIDTDLGSGNVIEEEWTWDEDGNLTRYDKFESATLMKTTSYTTWAVDSGTDVFTMYEYKIVEKRLNPLGDWFNYRKYEKTVTTYLDEKAPITIDEYTSWYFPEEPAWHSKEWVHRVGLPRTPGIVESSRNEYYEYSEADENWHLQRVLNEGGLTRPELTRMLKMDKIGMHFASTAVDETSIVELGVIEKEFSAYGLTTIEDVETAAKNFLHYSRRADRASVEIPMIPCEIGDVVDWANREWIIERITHKFDSLSTVLELSKTASLLAVQRASFGDPQEIGDAMVKLLETKSKRLNNAARGQIIAQIDYETYQVHIQGEAVGKTRYARIDYHWGEHFPPGKEVLLVRPTGKRSGWEIVTRRNDEPTVMSTAYSPLAAVDPELYLFTAEPVYKELNLWYDWLISQFTVEYDEFDVIGFEVDFDDGTVEKYGLEETYSLEDLKKRGLYHAFQFETEVSSGTEVTFTPKARIYMGETPGPWVELQNAPITIKYIGEPPVVYEWESGTLSTTRDTTNVDYDYKEWDLTFLPSGGIGGYGQEFKVEYTGSVSLSDAAAGSSESNQMQMTKVQYVGGTAGVVLNVGAFSSVTEDPFEASTFCANPENIDSGYGQYVESYTLGTWLPFLGEYMSNWAVSNETSREMICSERGSSPILNTSGSQSITVHHIPSEGTWLERKQIGIGDGNTKSFSLGLSVAMRNRARFQNSFRFFFDDVRVPPESKSIYTVVFEVAPAVGVVVTFDFCYFSDTDFGKFVFSTADGTKECLYTPLDSQVYTKADELNFYRYISIASGENRTTSSGTYHSTSSCKVKFYEPRVF